MEETNRKGGCTICAIIGSFSRHKVIELCRLNEYRGQFSHSIAYYDTEFNEFKQLIQNAGPIDYNNIKDLQDKSIYYIVHMQAPTFEPQTKLNIHPAATGVTKLYHNGILKTSTIKALQDKYSLNETWDTRLLLEDLNGDSDLADIDGSFSCLWYTGHNLKILRNEIAPMFIDYKTFDISSTEFDGSQSLPPNTIFGFYPATKALIPCRNFRTACNPYYFEDEDNEDDLVKEEDDKGTSE